MNLDHYNLHGVSLVDYLDGDTSAIITVINDSGERVDVPVSAFFRDPADWPLDKKAIELCRGRVLDIGAGAGCHTLVLEAKGFNVCAIDFLPGCVEVMRRRGARDARQADVFEFEEEPFDTIICMMNGLACRGGLATLPPFLNRVKQLLKPNGQFLVDSADIRTTATPARLAMVERRQQEGRYFGELDFQLEYKGKRGPLFTQLYVDSDTFAEQARATGFRFEIVEKESNGRYLARLTLA